MTTKQKLPTGIRERNGRYQMIVSRLGKQYVETFATLDEAVTARREMVERLDRSQQKPTQTITLQEAIDKTYSVRWEGTKGERTAVLNAKLIMKFYGPNTKLTDIDTNAVNALITDLKTHSLSNATINRKLACLSVILKTAEDCGYATAHPVFARRKEYRGRERFVSPEEEDRAIHVLEHWGKDDHRDVFITLIDTGMRTGELFRIQKQDVDLNKGKHGTITIWQAKNDRPRSVPMTKRVHDTIQNRLKTTRLKTDRVFPYTQGWLRNVWDRMKCTLNLHNDKQFVPHILRHTCASRLIQRGVPLMMVQKWLGHESIQSTMRYSHLAPDALLDLVED